MTTYRTLHDMQEAMDRTAKHIERRAEELEQQAAAVRVADAQITLPLEAPCVGQSACVSASGARPGRSASRDGRGT